MAEWFKAAVLKTAVGKAYRGFESHSLRHPHAHCAPRIRRRAPAYLAGKGAWVIRWRTTGAGAPRSNAVRRQRALGAIRMRRSMLRWLEVPRRRATDRNAGRGRRGGAASRRIAKRRATLFACGEMSRGRTCHPALRLGRPVRARRAAHRRGADGPRHRRGLCAGEAAAARHRRLSRTSISTARSCARWARSACSARPSRPNMAAPASIMSATA